MRNFRDSSSKTDPRIHVEFPAYFPVGVIPVVIPVQICMQIVWEHVRKPTGRVICYTHSFPITSVRGNRKTVGGIPLKVRLSVGYVRIIYRVRWLKIGFCVVVLKILDFRSFYDWNFQKDWRLFYFFGFTKEGMIFIAYLKDLCRFENNFHIRLDMSSIYN